MKKTVRILSLAIAIIMILSFAACSSAPKANEMEPEVGIGDSYFDGVTGGPSYSVNDGELKDDGTGSPEYNENEENFDAELGTQTELEAMTGSQEEKTTSNEGVEDTETETDVNLGNVNDLIGMPFTDADENNFSTFSADVDTASYTYFRKLVNYGYTFDQLKNSGSQFRTEEFINYFRYDSVFPSENELFGVYSEMTPCPWSNGETMLLRLTLQAPEAPESAGNNLVFLIDVSGSMSSSDKLPLLKRAFSYLVGNLTPADTISIVTYSGNERVVLDGCRGNNTYEIMDAINSLQASGSTNGEAGLTMAYQIAEKHMIEGGNNRIIMASDGDLNVGISSVSELEKYIENKRDQGVYLSVLGFGSGNYKDEKMEALADNGNGVYYYIDGESEAEKVFGTDLSGTLYTVANDVKLQMEFNKDWVEEYRLIGYDNRILDKEDFENDQKDAGEVGAGHQVTVVYEIKLKAQPSSSIEDCMMTLRVRYKNPGESLSLLNEYKIGTKDIRETPSAETSFIISVVELAALLRNPDYHGDVTIVAIKNDLKSLTLTDSYMAELREIVDKLAK